MNNEREDATRLWRFRVWGTRQENYEALVLSVSIYLGIDYGNNLDIAWAFSYLGPRELPTRTATIQQTSKRHALHSKPETFKPNLIAVCHWNIKGRDN